MSDERVKLSPFTVGYPMPVALLGTELDGKPSFMTLAWTARVSYKPPTMLAAVNRAHVTLDGIDRHRTFSISFPSEDQLVATDYVGIATARRADKSAVFELFAGELDGAPMVADAPVAMECKVTQTVELHAHTLLVGEVVSTWGHASVLDEKGRPDLAKCRPLILSMPDNRYWSIGAPIGHAWSDGKGYSGR